MEYNSLCFIAFFRFINNANNSFGHNVETTVKFQCFVVHEEICQQIVSSNFH